MISNQSMPAVRMAEAADVKETGQFHIRVFSGPGAAGGRRASILLAKP